MKKRKTRGTKTLTIKREISPNFSDTIKTEEVKIEQLPRECDIADIPIKQEEANLEVKHYDTILNQTEARARGTNKSRLTDLNEPPLDNNITEELNTNTTESSLQFECQRCNLAFKSEKMYNKHTNEVHKLAANNQQIHVRRKPNHSIVPDPEDPNFYCKSCNTHSSTRALFRTHLRGVHKMTLEPLIAAPGIPNHHIKPDPDDPNFYCKSCSTKYLGLFRFRSHIRNVHKMILEPRRNSRLNTNHSIQPDPEDPNFYCKSCNTHYCTRAAFRVHLRNVHKMTLEPLIAARSKPNHNIKPDPEDPNFYCKSCNIKFRTRPIFRAHLLNVHKTVDLPKRKKPYTRPNHSIEPDPDDHNFYCKSCCTEFPSRAAFRKHLRTVHKMILEPLRNSNLAKPNHSIQPDPEDPNFYCASCDTKYATSFKFRDHIRHVHKKAVDLHLKRKPNHSIKPDPEDPNFYCKSCSIKYSMRYIYRTHLRQTHKMILEPLVKQKPKPTPDHSIKPDPEDPNFYCKSCSIKYPVRYIYRRHIRSVHKIILKPLTNIPPKPTNHSIRPDPEDPNYYCKSCNVKYQSLYVFRRHISSVHKMALEPLTRRKRVYQPQI